MKNIIRPTDSELEILQLLWAFGPSSVRVIHEELSRKRTIFYTTTLKTMQVMLDKGLLDRDTSSRSHVYSANVKKSAIQKNIVERLKDTVFGGSMSQLVISAIGNTKPTKAELKAIRKMIDKLDEDV